MDILIADDDAAGRLLLETHLKAWGHTIIVANEGQEALKRLREPDAPKLAILDWVMPRMDGTDVVRVMRATPTPTPTYFILLTIKDREEDIVVGLSAGANDYIVKPFRQEELRARVSVGERVVTLQTSLAQRVAELEQAISRVKCLEELLPVCMYCKKIRDEENLWDSVENYLSRKAGIQFSHGVCPGCFERYVKPELENLERPGTAR